jgi:hypothetical protein
MDWQHELGKSWAKVGDLQAKQGEREAALKSYSTFRDIMQTLVQRDPNNTDWKHDLAASYCRMSSLGYLVSFTTHREWVKQCQTILLSLQEQGLLSEDDKRGLKLAEAALAKLKEATDAGLVK